MSIFKDVTKTIKNIFSPEDDMMFDDENDFEVENQNPFLKKGNDKKTDKAPKPLTPTFDIENHGFGMAKSNQQANRRSNGKIQIYVPKTFEEAFNIIKDVKAGYTAMVNVEIANPQISQRLIDVVSGAIYALDGDCKKMGEKQYIFSLSAETIGAYDYLPVNGEQNANQNMNGFNFSHMQNFDYNNNQMPPMQAPMNFGQGTAPNQFNQNSFNNGAFNQNTERAAADLQSFYTPPKSQF